MTSRKVASTKNQTPTPAEGGYFQLAALLPRFYLKLLDTESALLHMRRGPFLEMLLLRQLGLVTLERAPGAPAVKPPGPRDAKDLEQAERWVWHCKPDLKAKFDELRNKMGNMPPRVWIVFALHSWLGWPQPGFSGPPTASAV